MTTIEDTIAMLKSDELEIVTELNKQLEIIVNVGVAIKDYDRNEEMVAGYAQAIADVKTIFKDRYAMLNGMRE